MTGISIEERAIELAHYIIDSKDTVRGTAKKFGVSKSTVHTDVTLKNWIRDFQKETNTLLNAEKQIEKEDREKEFEMEL